ncbi:MAG: IS4 family transposase, partial [Bacteroidia bacterium]|nr:IS4 family transposase [Bacteroidia bacterium]
MIAIIYKGVAFPVVFKLLTKFGNSSTTERIELMDKFIDLFGLASIDCLMADREFVGAEWLQYLNKNGIRYYIRIRNNFILF